MQVGWGMSKVMMIAAVASAMHAAMAQELPRLVQEQGRATLVVDGKPFWMLGAQVDNSSGWPERLGPCGRPRRRCD